MALVILATQAQSLQPSIFFLLDIANSKSFIYFATQSTFNMAKDYLKDLSEIRSIMEKSSRFISLSGLTGVVAGIYALIGAFVANRLIYNSDEILYHELLNQRQISENLTWLILDLVIVFLLAVGTGVYFTTKKAKKHGVKTWDESAKRVIINLMIPLVIGGIFVMILYSRGLISLMAPSTLIFYGLALVNTSKYTFRDIRYLGLIQAGLGLFACTTPGYGLIIWALGFGVMHIVYGAVMYFKYER
jgi:hypothetical protein